MFTLTQSNRFEHLLDGLLANLAAEAPGPFDVQTVIVPSAAVRRRVELAQAERAGVCANLDFAFLARWLWAQIGRVVAVPETSPFAPDILAWRLNELLADPALVAAHPPLARYLAQADGMMRFDLAQALARVFDHYLTYRPDWLAAWSEGRSAGGLGQEDRVDEAWQAALWRRILADLGLPRAHPMARFFAAAEAWGAASGGALGLPNRVHLFCLPTLPPLYLGILRRLAGWMDLHLYILNPCQEYWFEIVDRKRLAWLAARQRDLYHEVGNRLLAAWGGQTKAQLELLFEGDEGLVQDQGSAFFPAPGKSLLARVHNAILNLEELAPGSIALAQADRSIEVHVCHSLTRELEVLHDQLLALLAGPKPPQPADILVLTPDLDAAAPLIEAVFGTAPKGRYIPFVITGRGAVGTRPALRAVDALLAALGSRCTASQILDLLQLAPIARRFGLVPADLERIHAWMGEAGIRWGLDEAARARFELPADGGGHSFATGLDRLFLAYALGDELEPELFAGRLPAGHPEGSEALALGAWWRFVTALGALDRCLAQPLDADGWRAALLGLVERFIAQDRDWAEELGALHAAIGQLHAQMVAGGATSPQPLAVIRAALAALLDEPARGGTPSGAVTFSALPTLRHLPYPVICLVGLNHGAFPGKARPVEFDLMARHPRPGDRQRREDERNLFLDALLAARERVYLSYTGRNIRDASAQPASVLVEELLDTLAAAIATDPADPAALAAARRRLIVEHPLQAFSPAAFLVGGDPRVASFKAEYCAALQARLGATPERAPQPLNQDAEEDDGSDEDRDQPVAPAVFFPTPLAAPDETFRGPSLADLLGFFRNPCQFLLTRRLGLRLAEGEESPADEEPFVADWPGRQALVRRLLPVALAGRDGDALRALARAGGEYPAGELGATQLALEVAQLQRFAGAVAAAVAEPPLPPLPVSLDFDLAGEAWRLEGALANLRSTGWVGYRYDEARAGDYLEAWLGHLLLGASAPAGVAPRTVWHTRDGGFALAPCADPRARLAELLTLYRQGLCAPLPFFPKSAWAYMEKQQLGDARQVWHKRHNPEHGESAHPAYALALRGVADPLGGGEFEAVARGVFGPLRAHLEPRS